MDSEKPPSQPATAGAISLLASHPDFPAANVEIYEAITRGKFASRLGKYTLGSEARMRTALRLLDIRAAGYLRMVIDMQFQNAYVLALSEIANTAWQEFAGYPITEMNIESPEAQRYFSAVMDRIQYWENEGYKRLIQITPLETTVAKIPRRGYRKHIRSWMKRKEIDSVKIAAKRLLVSDSTLKSIMSSVGDVRYSPETLERILNETGYQEPVKDSGE